MAALGAIGDPAGLPAVLGALDDKPTIRRRATVALAGFDDPRVDPALRDAAADRDWQVRQAAEELLADELKHQSSSAKRRLRRSKDSRHCPAPCTTHSSGVSTRWTGTAVASARRWVTPAQQRPAAREMDALENDVLGQFRWRVAQAGGAPAAITWATFSSRADRTSSGVRTTDLGRPVATSRPRISAPCSPG